MSHEFLDHIEDILDAMDKAELLVQGMTYAQFEADFRVDFALVTALEIIGEATKRLPEAVHEQYPEIPWKGMAGMRDRIIHGYDVVDLQIVWKVAREDLPKLKLKLLRIVRDFEGE